VTALRERLAQMKKVAKALDERWDHVTEDGTLGSVRGPAGEDIAQAQQRVNDMRHERRNLTAAHIANFNPHVAVKLIAVIDAARLVRVSDISGGFDDRVATEKMLYTALDALAAALGVSR
jgi:hypothetical protein